MNLPIPEKFTESTSQMTGEEQNVISAIYELAEACSANGWDGYGALPLSKQSVDTGIQFARLLPDDIAIPAVSAEPDGVLAFEWTASKSRRLSMGFLAPDCIAYAWLDGSDRGHAIAQFDGQVIPQRVLGAINAIIT